MSEKEAKARVEWLNKRQALLEQAVTRIQRALYERILERIEEVEKDPSTIASIFQEYIRKDQVQVVSTMMSDILAIGSKNAEYFAPQFRTPTDFAKIKEPIDNFLLKRFGMERIEGTVRITTGGYFDNLISDTTVRQAVQETAYKLQSTGAGLQEYISTIKDLVTGTPEAPTGIVERWFKTNALDTYSQADAQLQEQYSDSLNLTAALYIGGIIEGSRDFCRVRDGKVYLKEEIATWGTSNDKEGGYIDKSAGMFSGKTKDYVPQIARGGYACRHQLNYISNTVAQSMRSDLVVGPDGKLRVKGSGESVKVEEPKAKKENKIPDALKNEPIAKDEKFWNAIGNEVEVKNFKDNDKGSYYRPFDKTISISTKDTRYKQSPYFRAEVVHHEYGHAFHSQKNIITNGGVSDEFKEVFDKAKASLKKTPNLDAFLEQSKRLQKDIYGRREEINWAVTTQQITGAKQLAGFNAYEVADMAGVFADVVGSLTKGSKGWGHTKKYYKSLNNSYAELFAHGSSTYFASNPYLKQALPEVHDLFLNYFKKIEAGTYKTITDNVKK